MMKCDGVPVAGYCDVTLPEFAINLFFCLVEKLLSRIVFALFFLLLSVLDICGSAARLFLFVITVVQMRGHGELLPIISAVSDLLWLLPCDTFVCARFVQCIDSCHLRWLYKACI